MLGSSSGGGGSGGSCGGEDYFLGSEYGVIGKGERAGCWDVAHINPPAARALALVVADAAREAWASWTEAAEAKNRHPWKGEEEEEEEAVESMKTTTAGTTTAAAIDRATSGNKAGSAMKKEGQLERRKRRKAR